jgi:hypothetical protein
LVLAELGRDRALAHAMSTQIAPLEALALVEASEPTLTFAARTIG